MGQQLRTSALRHVLQYIHIKRGLTTQFKMKMMLMFVTLALFAAIESASIEQEAQASLTKYDNDINECLKKSGIPTETNPLAITPAEYAAAIKDYQQPAPAKWQKYFKCLEDIEKAALGK